MRRRPLIALALALVASAARAQPQKEEPEKPPPPEYKVDFRADRVDIEPDSVELQLSGNVVVTVARYRIVSDKLSLTRGPRGLEVDGAGEVALCPCEDAPLTLGFQAATVAPPTDVLLAQPTVRVGGVPVLWLPYLWLRSRARLGFIPPWLEWRGEDGLLIGAGAHLPTGGKSYRGRASAFDLRAAGYVQGGARVDALLDTSTSRTRVVWDHLDQSALRLEGLGTKEIADGATLAWVLDESRGPRGRRYPSSIDMAARRYDRALVSVGHAGAVIAGLGLRTTAERAGPIDSLGSAGPRLHFGAGGELARGAAADAAFEVTSSRSDVESQSLAVLDLGLDLEAPSGAVALGAELRQRVSAGASGSQSRAALEQGWFPSVALPLFRDYGGVTHVLEPMLLGAHVFALESSDIPGFDDPWPGAERLGDRGEEVWTIGAGLRNAVGTRNRALSLLGVVGLVGSDTPTPGAAVELASDLGLFGASLQGSAEGERANGLGSVRLGEADGFRIVGRADASSEGGDGAAQWLLPDNWESPAPLLSERGVSLGGELAIPWTSWLTSEFAGDYDATADELLALSSSLGYRHPCGCLSAIAWAGHRVGRGGFDAWLGIDLLP